MSSSAALYVAIVACEAAFWVVLAVALAARYLWRSQRLSRNLLFSLPGIDLFLLVFTSLDLRSGAVAMSAHGLATAYVGFTVAFGGVLVSWADQKFAHRFAGGPPPTAAPTIGWDAVRYEMKLWGRSIVAWSITLVLLTGLIAWIGRGEQTKQLEGWFGIAAASVVLWFVFGPLWSLVFFKKS